ncbi:Fis family transcriptional regulator [Burkholderia cenocepacia]|uniref:Fis family transcriptional regulator n=2 Tax=Burkholderia cepacia complex TaxID=87882 RepID=A0A6J5JCS9_9BURK|nr:Fis family transcriptional regulator [Burkholderia cenocepacia]
MLLPLPAAAARKRALEHHLALASLQSGSGTTDATGKVFQTIYIAYFIHEATVGRQDLDQFRAAEAAVVECAVAGRKSGTFEIPTEGRTAVEHILLMGNVPGVVEG